MGPEPILFNRFLGCPAGCPQSDSPWQRRLRPQEEETLPFAMRLMQSRGSATLFMCTGCGTVYVRLPRVDVPLSSRIVLCRYFPFT